APDDLELVVVVDPAAVGVLVVEGLLHHVVRDGHGPHDSVVVGVDATALTAAARVDDRVVADHDAPEDGGFLDVDAAAFGAAPTHGVVGDGSAHHRHRVS